MGTTEDFFDKAGGVAFPYVAEGGPDSGLHAEIQPGMTLRDYFAAQALTGFVRWFPNLSDEKEAAKRAYHFSDAMLDARKR